jgi:hypothetical protein
MDITICAIVCFVISVFLYIGGVPLELCLLFFILSFIFVVILLRSNKEYIDTSTNIVVITTSTSVDEPSSGCGNDLSHHHSQNPPLYHSQNLPSHQPSHHPTFSENTPPDSVFSDDTFFTFYIDTSFCSSDEDLF